MDFNPEPLYAFAALGIGLVSIIHAVILLAVSRVYWRIYRATAPMLDELLTEIGKVT